MEIKQKQRLISFRVSNQGFTIVELLVGMVVSLLAMGAVYSTFLSQHKSYLVQEQVAVMQQNLRAAMFYMQREIRMAGCDPLNTGNFGITTANANFITFTEDIRGIAVVDPPDGTLQAAENIIYSRSGGNLVRNVGGGNQAVAQNIDALDFVYLTGASPPVVLNPGGGNVPAGSENQIRSVEITIVARTGRALLPSIDNNTYLNQRGTPILGPPNDNLSRRRLTTVIKCRNLGL
ncbi:MAG: prepilin-type N-terminal cleavage/methylation domain-containing protein [Thermodesulfobacteriota bacterium]|nr:prepilin-type N-terminal cleavage/methylation domain-containing protein [Thermodesulfobacteriota bacterium]